MTVDSWREANLRSLLAEVEPIRAALRVHVGDPAPEAPPTPTAVPEGTALDAVCEPTRALAVAQVLRPQRREAARCLAGRLWDRREQQQQS